MVNMKSSYYKIQQGFTLIEVLVASTIVIISIGTLLQLFSAGLNQNQRVGQLAHLLSAQRTIMARIEQTNPAEQPKGQGIAMALAYQWKAEIIEPYQIIYEEEPLYPREIALFNITVKIKKPRGGTYLFNFHKLGWRNK